MQYIFLDTNVILDNDLFELAQSSNDEQFIIVSQVLEELNSLKEDTKNNRGYLQRKQLQNIYILSEKFPDKFLFLTDIKTNFNKRFSERSNDNIILNTVIEFMNEHTNDLVYLFTNDIQLILKQKLHNVKTKTNIKQIDISKILQKELKEYIVYNFEDLQNFIETNRFNIIENYKHINELNFNIIPIEKYFYVTDESKTYRYLLKRIDNDRITFVSQDSLIQKYYLSSTIYSNYNLQVIKPKSLSQLIFLDSLFDNNVKISISLSKSGTGKTLLQLFYQITEILRYYYTQNGQYSKIVYIVNPSHLSERKDLGFLPGTKHEKILPYMSGICDNINYLFNNKIPDKFNIYKSDNDEYFEIRPLSYLRGQSISNSIVIVDEVQNLTLHEIKSIVTRIADNSKLILLGDIQQIDERIQVDYVGIVRFVDYVMNHQDIINYSITNVHIIESQRSQLINIFENFLNVC